MFWSLVRVIIADVKKLISVILLFSLLSPAAVPLAALATAAQGAHERHECTTGAGHECMENGVCKMNHKQCKSHMAKMEMGREGHGGGHGSGHNEAREDEAPAPGHDRCDTFYSSCGSDDGPQAFSANPLETPFLLTSNTFEAARLSARLFARANDPYAGPYLARLERPPSASPSIQN